MNIKEQIYNLLDSFTDEQLEQVLIILNSIKKMINIESEDDAFCQKMIEDSKIDNDESILLDDFIKELGFNSDDLNCIDKE